MADKKTVDTEGEIADTPSDSPTEQKTPAKKAKTDTKVVKKEPSEAEKTWDSLSGKTQDRVVDLIRKNKQLETELTRRAPVTPKPTEDKQEISNVEIKEAIKKLREHGVATMEDFRSLQDRLYLDKEHDRLKTKYDGTSELPKYIPLEVEDYARTHGLGGNLEVAFEQMYKDELMDAEVKKRGRKAKTVTEKPTASTRVGEKPLSVESLKERLRKPDGAEWWAKNREKIEPHLRKLSQA